MSLGEKGADAEQVFDGYLSISVQQYIFCRWRKRLRFPELPCIIEWHKHRDVGNNEYFRLECTDVHPEKHMTTGDKTLGVSIFIIRTRQHFAKLFVTLG